MWYRARAQVTAVASATRVPGTRGGGRRSTEDVVGRPNEELDRTNQSRPRLAPVTSKTDRAFVVRDVLGAFFLPIEK